MEKDINIIFMLNKCVKGILNKKKFNVQKRKKN